MPLQLKHNGNFPSQGNPLLEVSGNGNTAAYNNSRSHCVIGCSLSITILFFSSSKAQHHLAGCSAGGHFLQCFVRFGKGEHLPHRRLDTFFANQTSDLG